MKPVKIATAIDGSSVKKGLAGATALVIGLSATGAVFFTTGEAAAQAKAPNAPAATSPAPRTVEKDLAVKAKDVKRSKTGIEFTSRDYAEAFTQDRRSVVAALQKRYPSIKDEQIKVAGNQIFIANPHVPGPANEIFENFCIHLTINLCGR